MSLVKSTAKSVKWVIISSLAQRVVTFGSTIILARLLSPAVFGLFALAFSVIDGFGLFKSLGLDSAIIQRKNDVDKAANTAFFLIPLMGAVVYVVLFLAAPFIGNWLKNEEIIQVLRILGVVYIINCFSRVPAVLLEKNMSFVLTSILNFTNTLGYSIIAVVLAWAGWGIWSLVYAYIFRTLIAMVSFYAFVPWRPKMQFDTKIAKEMFHFGKFLFLGSLLWYFRSSLDKAVVGKILNVNALGLYAIALNLANLVNDYITGRVQSVLFPAFAKIQDDIDKLKAGFLRVFKLVCFFALPFGCGLFLLGGDFLELTFGAKWINAIPVLKILAWASIFNTIGPCVNPVYLALGKPRLSFVVDFIQVFLFFSLVYPLAKIWGLEGVGMATLVSVGVSLILRLSIVSKLLHIKKKDFAVVMPILIAAIFMMLVTCCLQFMVGSFSGNKLACFIFIFSMAVLTYLVVLFKREKFIFDEIKNIILAK